MRPATRLKPSEAATLAPVARIAGEAVKMPAEVEQPTPNQFLEHIYTGAELEKIPPTSWLLKSKMPHGALVALYCEPGGGKSMAAIDFGISAALGESWWGEKLPACKVLYIAAERHAEVADRVRTNCKRRGVPVAKLDNFLLLASPAPPHISEHLDDLLDLAAKFAPDLVVFDTFSRMTLGIEENSTKDMGQVIENYLRVLRACGAKSSGLLIHHAGKDRTKGLRGSTALLGALDAVWRLDRREDKSLELVVEKINAADIPLPAYFTIEGVAMPDPETPGELRSVGVLVAKDYAQVASGIEGKLLAIMCELYEEGATLRKLWQAYNDEHPPTVKDAKGVSEATMRRALNRLRSAHPAAVEMLGGAQNSRYKPTAHALAQYQEAHPES